VYTVCGCLCSGVPPCGFVNPGGTSNNDGGRRGEILLIGIFGNDNDDEFPLLLLFTMKDEEGKRGGVGVSVVSGSGIYSSGLSLISPKPPPPLFNPPPKDDDRRRGCGRRRDGCRGGGGDR